MIFLFEGEQPADASFWMYRTSFPLSVAFLDSQHVIRSVRHMEPCRSWVSLFCPGYRAGVPFHSALEVSSGFLERNGIGIGDTVTLRRGR